MNTKNRWAERIGALRETGMSLSTIGDRIGLSRTAVHDLSTGRSKMPAGDAAVALYNLHRKRCGPLPPVQASPVAAQPIVEVG